MPWACIPFTDRDRKSALSEHFDVEGIPTLVILDENLDVLTTSAVSVVRNDADGSAFPWKAPLTSDIDDSCDGISEKPSLLVIQEGVDAAVQKANTAILTELAEKQAADE